MLSRREFLHSSSLIALAPTVQGFLAQTARAVRPQRDGRILVVIELGGGNDGINTVVPYADEGYAKYRKHLRLTKTGLVRVNDHVGLHGSFRDAGRLLEQGRLAIVGGVSYPNPSRSHFESMAVWHSAVRDASAHQGPGWLGRALDKDKSPADGSPASVYVGGDAAPAALRAERFASSSLAHLNDLVLTTDVHPRKVIGPARVGDDLGAFVRRSMLDGYAAADRLGELARNKDTGATYPASGLSGALRLVARLIKSGFGTRVYCTRHTNNGYDTHHAQLVPHAYLLAELGGALRAFLDDLKAARLEERVAVLVFSEFGRRVQENASLGTDHGTAAPVFLAGGRVRGGLVGATPRLLDLQDGDLKTTCDFRRVYATILDEWLGIPSRVVLGGDFKRLALFRE
jgi:uncharacterized protein (DUF1501 family)